MQTWFNLCTRYILEVCLMLALPFPLQLVFMVFFWLNLRLFILQRSTHRSGVHNSGGTSATTTATTAGVAGLVVSGGGGETAEENLEAAAASSEYGGIAVVDNVQYRKFSKLMNVTYPTL